MQFGGCSGCGGGTRGATAHALSSSASMASITGQIENGQIERKSSSAALPEGAIPDTPDTTQVCAR